MIFPDTDLFRDLLTDNSSPIVMGIVAISCVGWYLLLKTALNFFQQSRGGPDWTDTLFSHVQNKEVEAAKSLCKNHKSVSGRLYALCLKAKTLSDKPLSHYLAPHLEAEFLSIKRRMPTITMLASACPLLGLLGTVIGLVKTFAALEGQTVPDTTLMAGGISEALLSTQAGLLLALPLIIGHRLLQSRIGRFQDTTLLNLRKMNNLLART
jgi:biopolymer transport protein ExbB